MRQNPFRGLAAFLSIGLRPFFLASALWATLAIALWLGILNGVVQLPTRFDVLSWHTHEMVFGFILATVAGFLLTALPSWTGRPPVRSAWVAALTSLWALGRVACLVSALLPAWLAAVADLLFPATLTFVAAREIIAARNLRSLPVVGPLLLFFIADLLMQLPTLGIVLPPGIGWRLGITAALVLISLVGGRVVPAFTRNWLKKRGERRLPAPRGWPDGVAVILLIAGLIGWALAPGLRPLGYLLIAAGLANLWRLVRWHGEATLAEPLLLVLHIAYAWLAIGTIMLGLSMLTSVVPLSAAIHALTVGAIATMILALMTRATLGHTGHPLTAGPVTVTIYVFVSLGALLRIAAAFPLHPTMPLLIAAGICWIGAFLLFGIVYGAMILDLAPPRVANS